MLHLRGEVFQASNNQLQFRLQGGGIDELLPLRLRLGDAALQRLRRWHATPFVDTVDKMQGQQSWVVIVSYGVSDTETALQEADFIYGLNRLNVAITRAQAKLSRSPATQRL